MVLPRAYGSSDIIYSAAETPIGVWIDGKTIYQKVLDIGALPNATDKNVAHGISNLDTFISIFGIAQNPTGPTYLTLPYPDSGFANQSVEIDADPTNVEISTGIDRTNYTDCFLILRYTKN